MPLINCVANMQVIFRLDRDGDGIPENPSVNDISLLTARQIKDQVKEVRVYILAHEGHMDKKGYQYIGDNPITLGETAALGKQINMSTEFGADWDHYRWKIYTLFVKPRGLY